MYILKEYDIKTTEQREKIEHNQEIIKQQNNNIEKINIILISTIIIITIYIIYKKLKNNV